MSLEHELGQTRLRVPELYATILGSRHDPVAIRSERNTQDKVLVALESADALARLRVRWSTQRRILAASVEFPHSDRLVQRSGHEMVTTRAEGDRIHAVLMTLFAFCALHQDA